MNAGRYGRKGMPPCLFSAVPSLVHCTAESCPIKFRIRSVFCRQRLPQISSLLSIFLQNEASAQIIFVLFFIRAIIILSETGYGLPDMQKSNSFTIWLIPEGTEKLSDKRNKENKSKGVKKHEANFLCRR